MAAIIFNDLTKMFGKDVGLAFPSSKKCLLTKTAKTFWENLVVKYNADNTESGIVFLKPRSGDIALPANLNPQPGDMNNQELSPGYIYRGVNRNQLNKMEQQQEDNTFHNEHTIARLILEFIKDPDFRKMLTNDYHDVLRCEMFSIRDSCQSCMFTLFELKLRCAIEGVDLQMQLLSESDPADLKHNFNEYATRFSEKMEKLISKLENQPKYADLQDRLISLLEQFTTLGTAHERFEWMQRFLSTSLTNLGPAITLIGHYP